MPLSKSVRPFVVVVFALLGPVAAAGAGRIEDADAASDRHEFATEFRILRPLAEQGNPRALCRLGSMYQFIGRNEAFVYENEQVARDYAKAAKWYRQAAERGSAAAAHLLGALYWEGKDGIKQDYAEAAKWVRVAAERGKSGAAQFLGLMYEEGKGVLQDYIEAAKWYRRAADQGESISQYNLGRMYFEGKGLTKDYVQAYMWMNLATSRMSAKDREIWPEIVTDRDKVAKLLTPAQQVEAQKLAREWRPIGETPHMHRSCE